MTDAAFALYAAAECFACAISSSDLEEGVEYAEAAIAALPPCGHPEPDFVRELVEARDWRCLEMIARELDTRAAAVSQERTAERSVVSKPAKPHRKRKPSLRALIAQAEKAGKPVTSVTTPEGITLRFDQPESPAEASNPWLADLKVTKQ
jgi:hypothetical protein